MTQYNSYLPGGERPYEIELLRSMIRGEITEDEAFKLKREHDDDLHPNTDDAFISKTAADWLIQPKDQPRYQRLFGEFWRKDELCIMFADTNVGKSILAVQIGDAISAGRHIGNYTTTKQDEAVLYFDFELTAQQFAERYTYINNRYGFAPNFHRLMINPDAGRERKFASFHDYIINAFENVLVSTNASTIIIDNITCLRTSTESAAGAVKLMQSLKMLRSKYKLSVLVLAHTPKRNVARPITRNDLQGSKMLLNFADSAFAIGESQTTPGLRYLKQIKQRTGTLTHGADNVCLCRIQKHDNFLKFEFTGEGTEAEHLLHYTEQQRKATEDRVMQLHNSGVTLRKIAAQTGLSHASVARMVRRLSEHTA
ncbi:LuxR family transcriptional regulator [Mucilaginibacter terrenus]|uniref:LuxR family transcriptional regulator n=1 Tax=Mucilaginibacter terrenus TaxID=2482727 RepID=A0A3E2NSY1_9SPHI|nr:AAA family ATPase [Mucilaginibacter terrenus]RFZ84123.1 LuxR family transcriptional regulator [Mucilaginibacter terrenus]